MDRWVEGWMDSKDGWIIVGMYGWMDEKWKDEPADG